MQAADSVLKFDKELMQKFYLKILKTTTKFGVPFITKLCSVVPVQNTWPCNN